MRALTYHGARDVRVESVPDPVIQEPDTGVKFRPLKMAIFSAMNLWEL